MGETGYLQHGRDWTLTRDAIIRLAARLRRPFTYGELSAEIEEHDGLRIDGCGYAGALEAVAVNRGSTEPLWTSMVINADTGEPGEGLWKANPDDHRYADAGRLSPDHRQEWLRRQRLWCVAAARVIESPLDQPLRDAEAAARDKAHTAFFDLLFEEHQNASLQGTPDHRRDDPESLRGGLDEGSTRWRGSSRRNGLLPPRRQLRSSPCASSA